MPFFRRLVLFIPLLLLTIYLQNATGLIAPIRQTGNNKVQLCSCDEIKMESEIINFYHHPLGIWLVTYETTLRNITANSQSLQVGFPSGSDVRVIEGELICDYFENFKVFVNDKPLSKINYLVKCADYTDATGTVWTLGDGTGTGFLNTWKLNFKPDEVKRIKITFSFVVTKPPVIYNPNNQQSWYQDTMNWIKTEYSTKDQNQFKLPINLGSFWAFYPDSIVMRTYFANDWLKVVKPEQREYDQKNISRYEFSEPFGFYSPPEVYLTPPTEAELKKMTRTELTLLKYSFPAKYGKPFESSSLKLFFENQPWYALNPEFHSWYLTDWDIENIQFIDRILKSR